MPSLRCMQRMDSAKGPYYLVCRERETGKIVWRETYTIAVSVAPVADFGF